MYLLVKPDETVQLAKIEDALFHLNIGNIGGQIHFENIVDTISYSLEWTEEESLVDFIKCRLNKFTSKTGISIYKAELL